jgi:hypothetical protein
VEQAISKDADRLEFDRLELSWSHGYSVAELWGMSKPVAHPRPECDSHLMLWGILSIVEYQVSKGAGHRYLRDRLWEGDWIAIGYREPRQADARLTIVPPIKDAKFGRKRSAVGDGVTNYADVRILHAQLLAEFDAAQPR